VLHRDHLAHPAQPVVERHKHPRAGDTLVTLFKEEPALTSDLLAAEVLPKGRNFH
jgi:hypothetical protein